MSAVFRGIHSWTVFRDRLTGRGLGEFPGAWLNFTKFPIEVLTYEGLNGPPCKAETRDTGE